MTNTDKIKIIKTGYLVAGMFESLPEFLFYSTQGTITINVMSFSFIL